ncbi:Isoprenylcysteine carboxyl methyltransferase family-domain-containing protein [Podospora conica]|nr:Isoprenylcysteine carboxyl methyltransferase family-domain-containing protein [Schizothecium conicum]
MQVSHASLAIFCPWLSRLLQNPSPRRFKLGGLRHNGVSMHPCVCNARGPHQGLGLQLQSSSTPCPRPTLHFDIDTRCGTTHETLLPRLNRFWFASPKKKKTKFPTKIWEGIAAPPRLQHHHKNPAHGWPLSTALSSPRLSFSFHSLQSPDAHRMEATPDSWDWEPSHGPSSAASRASRSPDRLYLPNQPKSLSGIALRAFCLGSAFTAGTLGTLLTFTATPLWRLFFFLATLALFHFLEFWTTAAYNTQKADVSSFLLTANWPAYAIAHALATLECLVTNVVWPHRSWAPLGAAPLLCLAGVLLVAIGQTVRSVAMGQAGMSFNHMVQHQRSADHVLVTTGIYARLRHPSYFGFFWWALGTQLVMGNAVCFFLYAAALWRFFSSRVKDEEVSLVRFFGADYVAYRKRVGTKIPFVP